MFVLNTTVPWSLFSSSSSSTFFGLYSWSSLLPPPSSLLPPPSSLLPPPSSLLPPPHWRQTSWLPHCYWTLRTVSTITLTLPGTNPAMSLSRLDPRTPCSSRTSPSATRNFFRIPPDCRLPLSVTEVPHTGETVSATDRDVQMTETLPSLSLIEEMTEHSSSSTIQSRESPQPEDTQPSMTDRHVPKIRESRDPMLSHAYWKCHTYLWYKHNHSSSSSFSSNFSSSSYSSSSSSSSCPRPPPHPPPPPPPCPRPILILVSSVLSSSSSSYSYSSSSYPPSSLQLLSSSSSSFLLLILSLPPPPPFPPRHPPA